MKIVVTGSSGLIGSALVPFLGSNAHQVFKLHLSEEIGKTPISLEGMDAVVHLAGENIMGRWTKGKKENIWKSRVEGTKLLCETIFNLQNPPRIFISASAIGFYGDRGDEILTEESLKGNGFLSDVCLGWEESTRMLDSKAIRVANLRFGMVLSIKGGALKQMLSAFKWGLGGKLGSGRQWMSWLAIDDLIHIIDFVLKKGDLQGPLNAVSPFPVTNEEFTQTFGRLLHRPTLMNIPAWVINGLLGELGREVLLASERAIPKKLQEAGFSFAYPHLEYALRHLLNQAPPQR